jgi:hypothetical protein
MYAMQSVTSIMRFNRHVIGNKLNEDRCMTATWRLGRSGTAVNSHRRSFGVYPYRIKKIILFAYECTVSEIFGYKCWRNPLNESTQANFWLPPTPGYLSRPRSITSEHCSSKVIRGNGQLVDRRTLRDTDKEEFALYTRTLPYPGKRQTLPHNHLLQMIRCEILDFWSKAVFSPTTQILSHSRKTSTKPTKQTNILWKLCCAWRPWWTPFSQVCESGVVFLEMQSVNCVRLLNLSWLCWGLYSIVFLHFILLRHAGYVSNCRSITKPA